MTEASMPLQDNWRARYLLDLLEGGPRSTIDLQRHAPFVHVARQIWELRHWYGVKIKTRRLENRVALYELEAAS